MSRQGSLRSQKILGRGTLYLMSAQVVLMGTGYVMHFVLGRNLGPDLYGIFGVVLYLTLMLREIFLPGFSQAVSKYTAENNKLAFPIIVEGIKIQLILSIFIFLLYFSLSGFVANLLSDVRLVPYLRLSAFIIPLYGIYSVFCGSLNGLRKFKVQSLIWALRGVARAGFVIALVFLGFSVGGAVLGLVLAAFVMMLIAWYLGRLGSTPGTFQSSKLIGFGIPIIIYSSALFLLLDVDLLFVKGLLLENAAVGLYTSAKTLARVPYFIFNALSHSLFPSISRSFSVKDIALTKKYINQSLRYTAMILVPIASVVSGTAESLVRTVYSSGFAGAGTPLSILIFGISIFSVFMILSTIIMATGRPKISMIIALGIVPINIVLNYMLIPRYELVGAALATLVSFLGGLCVAAVYIYVKFKTLMSIFSLLRISAASVIIFIISIKLSFTGMALAGEYIVLFALYVALLFFFGEIRREDMRIAKDILAGILGR